MSAIAMRLADVTNSDFPDFGQVPPTSAIQKRAEVVAAELRILKKLLRVAHERDEELAEIEQVPQGVVTRRN